MSFAASWYRASCAFLLLTLYFSMFSFYPPFLLSLSLLPLSLCGCKTRVIWCPLPNILFLINLTFHTLSLHSSYKIHQPFTDYLLRLPSSELLEKHLFRSRANRRLVFCCLVLSVRGKIRISDRGMCTSSLRLVLSFVFATFFVYSCTGISMRFCLIYFSLILTIWTEPLSVIGRTRGKKELLCARASG